jgi:hypothetical protein
MTSINFADTFAHSLVSVAGMVKNHILVEAFVTQRLTSQSLKEAQRGTGATCQCGKPARLYRACPLLSLVG